MLVIIDNFDSFTYNLYQYLGELGVDVRVFRSDAVTIDELRSLSPEQIVISPGPGVPAQAGISVPVVRELGDSVPILGVCLGHQAIAEAFGGNIVRAPQLYHGKTSIIHHDGSELFAGIENDTPAMRYHSLIVEEESLPDELVITARAVDGEIMAVRHCTKPIYGVQFHPESIYTAWGKQLLVNFLDLSAQGGGRSAVVCA